jgi:cytochrome c oxidase assembly protein subunit 11
MQNETPPENASGENSGRLSNRWLYTIVVGSFIFAFGSIPAYRIVCKKFDPGGSAWANGSAEIYNDQADTSRSVRVRFTTSVERQLPFEFTSAQNFLTVHPGARGQANFQVRNLNLDRSYRAKAVYDINPPEAGQYFKKIQCFCFDEQTIGAGVTNDLPLIFWFDSKMPDHIKEVTIAYTFFNMESSMERSDRKQNEQAAR